jgi:hypothetical protein
MQLPSAPRLNRGQEDKFVMAVPATTLTRGIPAGVMVFANARINK